MAGEFKWRTYRDTTTVKLCGMTVASYSIPRNPERPIVCLLNQQRRGWRPPGDAYHVEVRTSGEARKRMEAWLDANRNRLFREVARARYPGLAPDRAAARLYRELRG